MDKVCNMCGDIGVSEELVTCNRCKKTSEHIYCMNERRKKTPVLWYCQECLKCPSVIHKEIQGKSKKPMTVYCNTSNVKNSDGLGKRSLRVDMNQARNSIVHNGTENKSKKQKVVYDDSNKFNLRSNESPAKRSLGNDTNETKAADGKTRVCSSKYVMTKQHVSNHKDSKKQEKKDSGIAFRSQTLQLPLPLIRNQDEKLSTSHCAPEACWKGAFKIFEVLYHDYKGIRAHLPCFLCSKVEKFSKELPKTVTFKKVSPRRQVWPKIFWLDPPTKEDIGLYFFPSEQERFKERYTCLLKQLDDRDFALQACMKDTQLLIFSSNQLPQDSRRIRGEPYLWGVFRHMKRKEPSKHTGLKSLSTPTPTKPVDQYMAGHKENVKTIEPISSNMTPGFIHPNSKDFNHVRSSFNKSPLNMVADTVDPDTRPGFSEIRPPRPSEPVSSRLDVQLDTKFKNIDIVRNNNINKPDVLIPSIGTSAPDFSKTHSREIDPVKMSFIEFPSNQLANPIVQDIPPGFNKILHHGFSGPPKSKHQDSSCESMFKSPMLSRIDEKKNVEVPYMTPGFIHPNSKDFNLVRSSFNKSPLNMVANTVDPDTPPGFSEIRPPRPSEPVSSRLDVQLDTKFKKIDIVRNNNINKPDVLIPSIGTSAPDFSKTHSREIDPVKRSFIEFPSNQLADPIVQDIPPGFNKILHRGYSGPPKSKHQDSSCETMFKSPMLSRIDDKKNVEVPLKKMAVPIDPDVPPGFSKMEFASKKVANSIDFDVPPGLSKLPPPGFSELLWSKQRHSSCNTTFHGAIQSSIDGINCLPSFTKENISQASNDHDVKLMSFQASYDWSKSSEHPKSDNLTLPFEENRWLYVLGSSKSCAKIYAPSENLPSSSTLERLCGSSDNHSSLMHRTVKVEMLGDEKIQRKDICTPITVPDVPPGFSKLMTAGFSAVKIKCPQAFENLCKSTEPPEGSTLICSTENRESCTELHPTSDNLPPSPTTENVCGSSDTLSRMHKTMTLEMLGDEKIDRRGTSITRVDIMPDSLKANLEKNKSSIRFSLKKRTSPICASVPHCFLVGKTKDLEDSSKGPCPLKVDGKDMVSSLTVENHSANAPKDCQVQSKCPKATDCGQSSAEHPSNSLLYHVKERKGFSSFASPDAHSKHQSIIKNRTSSASPLPLKKKAHYQLSPSLNLESLSAVKKILLEYKEKGKIKERDRQRLKSENLTCDKEKMFS